jgi:hypothetical protein
VNSPDVTSLIPSSTTVEPQRKASFIEVGDEDGESKTDDSSTTPKMFKKPHKGLTIAQQGELSEDLPELDETQMRRAIQIIRNACPQFRVSHSLITFHDLVSLLQQRMFRAKY